MPINFDTVHQETFDNYLEFDLWLRGGRLNSNPSLTSLLMQDGSGYIKFYTKRKRWKSKYPYYRIAVIGEYGGEDSPITEVYIVNVLFTKEDAGGRDNMKVLTIFGEANIKAAKHQLYNRRKEEQRQKAWEENRWERQRKEEEHKLKELKTTYRKVFGRAEYNLYKDDEKMMKQHLKYNAQFDKDDNLLPEYR